MVIVSGLPWVNSRRSPVPGVEEVVPRDGLRILVCDGLGKFEPFRLRHLGQAQMRQVTQPFLLSAPEVSTLAACTPGQVI